MALRLKFPALFIAFLVMLASALAENSEWQPIVHSTGLFFKVERQSGGPPSCIVRLREDKKLRRTTSDLSITYRFEQTQRSQNYSARFEARDTDTVYLDSCEQVVNIVATKVQRW